MGNLLLGDEGVGVHVVRALGGVPLPGHVEVLDGGTAGLDLVPHMWDRRKLVVVDAVRLDDEPGSIYRFTPGDVRRTAHLTLSVHQIGMLEAVEVLGQMGQRPETVIIGIVPKNAGIWSLDLSPEVKASVPRALECVLGEIF